MIPILDYQQACDPVAAIEAIKSESNQDKVSFIPVAADLAQKLGENAFALKIKDDSMNPELRINDLLLVSLNVNPSPGNFVVALINGAEAVIVRRYKQLSVNKNFQSFELKAENDNWGNITLEKVMVKLLESFNFLLEVFYSIGR